MSAWEKGCVQVGEQWIHSHLIISAQNLLIDWNVSDPNSLTLADLELAISFEPELIILGTGNSVCIPNLDLMAEAANQGIGLEIMDTPAACRTYNVLVHENRAVVAALFLAL
ncbi:MTH938/NDUFAF3 family protein [Gammaproteobacteria bacterium]|nr:MTH938/NDUFAF3 family protein [Gammaproteobacteria bacterium]